MDKAEDLQTDTATPKLPPVDKDPQMITVTVTKFGDGQVSTGEHVAGEGDIYAKRGEKMIVSRKVAESLEVRGFAEID